MALLLIDWFGPWTFPEREQVLSGAGPAAQRAAGLSRRAREHAVPVIYANDNFGQWRSDFRAVVATARAAGDVPARIAECLAPQRSDYFVLKPALSAFHATPLDLLLQHLGVHRLVLAGVSSNQCVLATAFDGHMRSYEVTIAGDACAAASGTLHEDAVRLARAAGAVVRAARAIRWP